MSGEDNGKTAVSRNVLFRVTRAWDAHLRAAHEHSVLYHFSRVLGGYKNALLDDFSTIARIRVSARYVVD